MPNDQLWPVERDLSLIEACDRALSTHPDESLEQPSTTFKRVLHRKFVELGGTRSEASVIRRLDSLRKRFQYAKQNQRHSTVHCSQTENESVARDRRYTFDEEVYAAMARLIHSHPSVMIEHTTRNKKPVRQVWTAVEVKLVARAIEELRFPSASSTNVQNVTRLLSTFKNLGGNSMRNWNSMQGVIQRMVEARKVVLNSYGRDWRTWFDLAEDRRRVLVKGSKHCSSVLLLMDPEVFTALDDMENRISARTYPGVSKAAAQPTTSHQSLDNDTMSGTKGEEVFTGEVDEEMTPPTTALPEESFQTNDQPANPANVNENVDMEGPARENEGAEVGATGSTRESPLQFVVNVSCHALENYMTFTEVAYTMQMKIENEKLGKEARAVALNNGQGPAADLLCSHFQKQMTNYTELGKLQHAQLMESLEATKNLHDCSLREEDSQ